MKPEDVFFEIHEGLPREGPGDEDSTLRALGMVSPGLPSLPRILDIGCGPGLQTLVLARKTRGTIVAVDTHQPYLDELNRTMREAGFQDRVRTLNRSMDALGLEDGSFDLIWSEGAIYIMGFREGLEAWRPLLAPEGALAVTHISWLSADPPEEVRRFWEEAYPAIRSVEENLDVARACGYEVVGHFALPGSAWWDDYYRPMEARIAELRERYREDEGALAVLDGEAREIELYRRHGDSYGYVFYVLRAK